MADFVIDNSVVMAWCFIDEESTYADSVLKSLESANAVVPAIWPLEVGNVLVVAERRKRLSEADIIHFFSPGLYCFLLLLMMHSSRRG